jgi:hypothetical protein
MATDSRTLAPADRTLASIAWGPVLAVAGALVAVEVAFASGYGYHRDELYFLEVGQHPAWGHIDQPPITPLLGRLSTDLFGDSLRGLRIIPALVVGVIVVLAALICRELGGTRRPQIWAAATTATSTGIVFLGHQLTTPTFDVAVWLAVVLLVLRLVRLADPRWWLAVGLVAGVGLENKHLVALLGVGLVVGLVATGRGGLLKTGWFAGGVALAFALWLPNLLWQADHGWPQIELGRHIAEEDGVENRITLLPLQLVLLSPFYVVLMYRGLRRLWSDLDSRFLVVAYGVSLGFLLLTGGKAYYVIALLVVLLVGGVVDLDGRGPWLLLVGAAVTTAVVALPVLPIEDFAATPFAEMNDDVLEMTGWDDVVVPAVAEAYRMVPEADRDRVVILSANYGVAGAIDRFGPAQGLPEPFSGHNAYADFRRPDEADPIPLLVGYDPGGQADEWFTGCELVGRIDNGQDIDNDEQGSPIQLCDGITAPWSELWPEIRHIS